MTHPLFSAIRDHSEERDHPISSSSFSVVASASNDFELQRLESLYIGTLRPSLNQLGLGDSPSVILGGGAVGT